jgi:glycogen synthase
LRLALFSKSFLPNVGGIETSSAMLAEIWTGAGHEVDVVTAVPENSQVTRPYHVTRSWSARVLRDSARRADVVICNGYSRVGVVTARLAGRRPIVLHQGYQLICTDGLGFRGTTFHDFDPIRDLSLAFAQSTVEGLRGVVKMSFDGVVRRWPGLLTHVVPSVHVARRLKLESFRILYQPPNPAVVAALASAGELTASARVAAHEAGDVVFFGRLVFEKGVDDLLRAFKLFRGVSGGLPGPGRTRPPRLAIYGEGPERDRLVRLADELGIDGEVDWRPFVNGARLAELARSASVVVVPSRWEEPGATIAVELFACGAAVIASESGAPGEIFRDHGRLFRNGDVQDLARQLSMHLTSPRYPHPTGREPWAVPAIVQAALDIVDSASGQAA